MASIAAACRLSSRAVTRQLRRDVQSRGYRSSRANLAAQNFTMPALSPTMTEGNIATWKVKEGDSFVAGDVLLEIETDKASMDVEAQDDGIVAKIIKGDGTKGIAVGARIGVLAESGDDISSLEIPAEESVQGEAPKKQESPKEQQPAKEAEVKEESAEPAAETSAPFHKSTREYPLLPSVAHLVHEHGIAASDVDKIKRTGPKNKLLKGDILAHLGQISTAYPKELAGKVEKLSHLDLSNIKIAPPKEAPKKAAPAPVAEPVEQDVQVALPISMAAALEVQARIQRELGTHLPLSTFIARAADFANDDLPRSKNAKPSQDELFDDILGLNAIRSSYGVRGNFLPQITALPHTAMATVPRVRTVKQDVDVLDFLTGKVRSTAPTRIPATPLPGPAATTNIFSVSVPEGDERQGLVFLERVKEILEEEPGSLVL
ncbi:pyridoxine biosynthesis protein [Pseudogymnoascus destructans]|uniref:Pyridoxine biosynthesis protein n=2 Tax=Pseudogymnoascus destructans TaxID=655981 RepID=L8FZT7_PSED2|nr:pyridoxine biosynthesis protein [Pseudogymnoascus destructans]ELR05988.1 hypothetical protein GMDG_01949 [Pseudogymnoascus destructans 20631-21]OAF55240.1 pyridoxine biosynthesis protein [Pseudogymnoascus destructans]